MANPLNIYVDDTSPSITYFPFGDTFGVPDQFTGWNPYYSDSGFTSSPNQTGQGNSLHLTSLDGASFSVQWGGTGIQLFGNCSQATYNITLDGAYTQAYSSLPTDNLLAEFHDLSDANHTLTLTVHTTTPPTSDSHIAFDKAVIISATGPGDNSSTFVSQTADNNDIAFLGQWSFVSTPEEHGRNHSFHQSTHAGDRFEFTFQGRIVTLYGLVSADCGQYSVTLDNETTTLSARSSSFYPHALLFYATDLDDHVQHQLIVQNEENRVLAVRTRGLNYTSFLSSSTLSLDSSSATTSGTKAAIALACVLSFLLLLIFLCYFFIYRPRVRQNNTESLQRRREKEAEAGIGGVLDISAEARALARRGSGGTSFGFAGFRFGTGSQRTKSVDIDADSYGSWKSFRGGARRARIDRHSQWDTYTIDLPSISPNASQRSLRQQSNQRDRFPSQSSLRPSRSPKSSFGTRSAHARLGSGALLLNNWGAQDNEGNDAGSAKVGEIDYPHAVEFSLSPRTSVAHFLSGIKTSMRNSDGEEHGAQSRPDNNNQSPEKIYLNVQEGSPFRVDFVGIGGSRENDTGTGRSPLSQVHSQTEAPEQLQESQDGRARRISQVKFDTSGPPPPYPKFSFLDFGSSISNDASSSSQRSGQEKSRWSATTVPSQAPSVPDTESSSASNSIHFDVPPIPPSPIVMQQSSSFPFPVSMPHSPHHLQVPSLSRSSRRHPSGPITGQLPLLSVPSSYLESRSASPTDSVPVSVSDIHFRHLSTSDGDSHRTSAGSQLPPHPPLPRNESPPKLPPTSLIVQKLLGLNTGSSMSPRQDHTTQISILEAPAIARQEQEPEVSTPFIQRVLGFGAATLNPRHNRTSSQDVLPSSPKSSSPKSSSSEQSRH